MRAIWLAVAIAGAGLLTACKDTTDPQNAAPSANFTFSCPALDCSFQDGSTDDGQIVSWSWNFGTEGSSQRNPIYNYPSAGAYDVSLTVTDDEGASSTVTKSVNPKAPAVTTFSCRDANAQLVACTLKLEAEAGFKVVLNSSSCEAHGNVFRVIAPTQATLTTDGCYQAAGTTITLAGPYAIGTEINAEVVAPMLQNPPKLIVVGEYPVWHLTYEDGADADYDDLDLTLTAIPTGR